MPEREMDPTFDLSRQQQRLIHLAEAGWPLVLRGFVDVRGPLDADRLRRAAETVVARHEALRTTFESIPGLRLPRQRVRGSLPPPPIGRTSSREGRADEAGTEEPASRPPLRLEIAERRGEGDGEEAGFRITVELSPLVADAESLRAVVTELSAAYAGDASEPSPHAVPDEPVQYAEFTAWQAELAAEADSEEGAEEGETFRASEGLSAAREQLLPLSRYAEGEPTGRRRPGLLKPPEPIPVELGAEALEGLRRLADELGVPLASVLAAGWQALILRLGPPEARVAVAEEMDGRPFAELEGALGPYALPVPVAADLRPHTSFRRAVVSVHQAREASAEHQEHAALVELPDPAPAPGEKPVFPQIFRALTWPAAWEAGGLAWSFAEGGAASLLPGEPGAVCLTVHQAGGEVRLRVEDGLRPMREMPSMTAAGVARSLAALLRGAAADPDAALGDLPLLGGADRDGATAGFHRTAAPFPADSCLHELIDRRAAASPDAPAVLPGRAGEAGPAGRTAAAGGATFDELVRRSNRLARVLRRRGVGLEDRVGVCVLDPLGMLTTLLAVLKAGAAYVPLDPGYPEERFRFILDDARVKLLVSEDETLERLPAGARDAAEVLLLDAARSEIDAESDAAPPRIALPESLAYVLYTSGSTGRPKGVMVPHRGVVNYLHWAVERYEVAAGEGAPVHTPIGFDLTVTALFAPLLAGRPLRFVDVENGVEALALLLREEGDFSLIKATPTQLKLMSAWLPESGLAGRTRFLVVGGEALGREVVDRWREHAPRTRIINEYGPTETVVGCAVHELAPGCMALPAAAALSGHGAPGGGGSPEPGPIPIGRPIANTRIYLLDRRMRPVPSGAPGEIYVGGAGVSRGYLGAPASTAAAFVPDPFAEGAAPEADGADTRLYRTGDLGVLGADGNLVFLGRADRQVKVRGWRIEPGEVEAAVAEHPSVAAAAVVVAGGEGEGGGPRLVAYVVPRPGAAPETAELLAAARRRLPEAMVPSAFVTLDALPFTAHGKLDVGALPEPERTRPRLDVEYAEAASDLERRLAALWRESLGIDRVGIHDNFFDLGGHSYLMFQLHGRLAGELDREVPMMRLFQHPTIHSLASFLAGGDGAAPDFRASEDRGEERSEAMRRQRQRRRQRRQTAEETSG